MTDTVAPNVDIIPEEVENWEPSPEQRNAQTDLQQILNKAIENLDPPYRTVFVLRDVEELSTEETAALLGISVPAVKSRLLRARLKMREQLQRYFRKGDSN